jgi:hypothetical protein
MRLKNHGLRVGGAVWELVDIVSPGLVYEIEREPRVLSWPVLGSDTFTDVVLPHWKPRVRGWGPV